MRRWILTPDQTGLAALQLDTSAPLPEPGPGEVRLRVRAVALNHRDKFVLDALPGWRGHEALVPLADASGEIDAIGSGVTGWQVGDTALTLYAKGWISGPPPVGLGLGMGAGSEQGVLSDYIVLPAERLARAPAGLDWAEAASLPCAGVTAWTGVFGGRPVGPGMRVLATGTGGVALLALVLAKAAGAEVYGLSSNAEKIDKLQDMGVQDVINYHDEPEWGTAVLRKYGGVDLVIDTVGNVNRAMSALRPCGEVAVIGLMSQDGPLNPMIFMGRTLTLRGNAVGSAADYETMRRFIETNGIRPPIGARIAFEDAPGAYAALRQGVFGKVVIELGN
ncbi:NAD(P)-dependent alcohol dehydrogenase [Brucella pseudogrignonensis]|uniref:zinc-dependent alcohol dehydrogenase family protein n=1 Tax=Brucella pseudogrignonensis TaxID=419475 RepID=UPI001EDB40A3|nr:NAD(P)-dependent alcohol dehydrogenase [Brucella pseudogrignonensis]UKK94699.1 NAD(P)-dependent alcohol dehydrogenase [Brucella pseudogrignonensis]